MDLDIMASVCEQIIGNCLCVLGDAMAMPIGSMIKHFRDGVRGAHRGRARAQRPRRRDPAGQPRRATPARPDARARRHRPDRGGGLDAAPRRQRRSRSRSTAARSRRPRTRCWSTPPSTATSRSRSSVTSPSSASRSAPAACAWSRSRASRSSRPACSTPVKDGMVVHTQTAARARRPARGRRVPAHQPPARLPGLRQGRRVPAAGHHLRLGPGHLALHRAQAPLQEAARALAADRDRPRALHPLLPLRALLAGDLRGLPADPARARRALVRRHVRRPPVRRAVQRQHHRAVPGRRAHLDAPTASARARGTSRAPARSARSARRSATSS